MRSKSPVKSSLKKFISDKFALFGLIYVLMMVCILMLTPLLVGNYDEATQVNIFHMSEPPSSQFLLGTDLAGRDMLTLFLYGGRYTFVVGLFSTIIVTVVGTIVGITAGYFGGKIDELLMRLTDLVMNFPLLLFAIVLKIIFVDSGEKGLILILGLLYWSGIARVVRMKVKSEMKNEYIVSARASGCSSLRIMRKHLFPNVSSTILSKSIIIFGTMVMIETGLTFLGFGVPGTTPTWGNILETARNPNVLEGQWWVWVPASTAIVLLILSMNFVGEGVKKAFEPK